MNNVFDFIAENPMAAVIVAGEVGFWVFVAGGLLARYGLRLRRTSTVLLAATPVIDVLVLVAAVVDVSGGGTASTVHGLAAVYLGFSVAFGPAMVRWADVRFAHRFAGGPRPRERPTSGKDRWRIEWREWAKCVLACSVAAAVLLVLIFMVGTPDRTRPLIDWLPRLGIITGIWFVVGPLWHRLSGKDSKDSTDSAERVGR